MIIYLWDCLSEGLSISGIVYQCFFCLSVGFISVGLSIGGSVCQRDCLSVGLSVESVELSNRGIVYLSDCLLEG